MARKTGANRGTDSGDFILSLKRLDSEVFVTSQFVQDVRGRRDWIRAIEELPAGELRGGHKPDGRRFVAGNLSITSRCDHRLLDGVMSGKDFGGFREVVTGLQGDFVRFYELGVLFELGIDPVQSRIKRPVVKPVQHAQSKKVLAAIDLLARELHGSFQRVAIQS